MKLHLDHNPDSKFTLNHKDQLFCIGSCFSGHISEKLANAGFRVHKSPSGIIYNPLSVAAELKGIIEKTPVDKADIIERDSRFYSLQVHSSTSAKSLEDMESLLTESRVNAYGILKNTKILFVTFGSAYYYKFKLNGHPVANCHKLPGDQFDKFLCGPEQIRDVYGDLIRTLNSFNPALKVVFTLSPVRHLRDGLEQNTLSKSILRYAIDCIVSEFDCCDYFPSYELIAEDLRDYRFYKADLMHPNEQAIDYVWEKFSKSCFDNNTIALVSLYEKLSLARAHKVMHPGSLEFQKHKLHMDQLEERIQQVQAKMKA